MFLKDLHLSTRRRRAIDKIVAHLTLFVIAGLASVQPAQAATYMRGVNVPDAAFGSIPGVLNYDYGWASDATYNYLGNKGLNVIRLAILWERIQPTLGGPLDPTYLAAMDQQVAYARAHGCQVFIDVHNYCRYAINEGGTYNNYIIDNVTNGVTKVPRAQFDDLWVKLSTHFKGMAGIWAYDIMNEPYWMGTASWPTISQEYVNAIRNNGDNMLILVDGDAWSNCAGWASNNPPTSWINDPANNFMYDAHCYFDHGAGGAYDWSYATELANNPNIDQIGVQRLSEFANWCTTNHVNGFLGEFGVPNNDDPRWYTNVLQSFYTSLDANGFGGTYWSAGERWGSHFFSVEPFDGFTEDQAPMQTILAHLSNGGAAPPTPTNFTATAGNAQVALSWTAVAGATSYNVKRTTVFDGPVAVVATTAATSYTDTGLVNGMTYYYGVSAKNAVSESGNTPRATTLPNSGNTTGPAKINCGGGAASPFVADADFSGGTPATNWTSAIDTSAVTSPAPETVYQSERYGAMTYTIGGLTTNASYTVRLHFCENFFTASAQRVFNVAINGTSVLSNFDIFATTGAAHKAYIFQGSYNADGGGQIVIAFTNVTNNALINGIEVNGNVSPPPTPTGLTATAGDTQVALSWTASSGATSYNVQRSTVSGSGYAQAANVATTGYTNTGLTNGTTYYFVVNAQNAGGTSANSAQVSAAPVAVALAQIAAGTAVIDGTAEATWNSVTAYSITKASGAIGGSSDLSATWKAMWDSTNLYVLVVVTDDVKKNDSTNVWDDDAVELFLDADHNGGTVYDASDRQVICGWGDAAPVEGAGRSITGATFAKADPSGTTYRIEAKVPWSIEAFTPSINAIIGVDVHVDDDDDGAARDGKLAWQDGTDQAWTNPSLFGTGKLLPGTGTLTGSVATIPASVNLSTEGTIDWAHWGLNGVAPGFDHKSTGGSKISTYSVVGTGAVGGFNVTSGQTFAYSWTGGTPTARVTNSESGVSTPGVGNGFSFTAPADTTQKILKVYCGGWASRGQITAHLSDGSALDYVDSSQSAAANTSFNVVYTLTYKAGAAGQTLTVTWKENTDNSGNGSANASLHAATLH